MSSKSAQQGDLEEDMPAGAEEEEQDTDSDSDSEVEVDPKDMHKIMALEAELERAPNAYDIHVQYIELLRKAKLRERARTARSRMHELYPFNEGQWMDWVNDELDAVRSAEDVARVGQLYQEAVKDYLSVNIWVAYLQFLLDLDAEVTGRTIAGLEAFRAAAEAAISAAGLHLTDGARLWQLYRGFEHALLEEAAGDSKTQCERVRALWHRQLAVPLAGQDGALQEYEQWEANAGKGSVPDHIRKVFVKAQEGVGLRRAHEEACAADKPADTQLLAAYIAYIQLERTLGDPARVQVMYERALAAFPVTAQLWLQYTRYVEATLRIPAVINATYRRAVRNCPWVGELWARALRALESGSGDVAAEHEKLYQQALQAGLQGPEDYMEVLLARADFLRRRAAAAAASAQPTGRQAAAKGSSDEATALRRFFAQAGQLMEQYWPQYLDRSMRLPAYHAHCEAHVLHDPDAAKEVWEGLIKGPMGKYYEAWSGFAAMERSLRRTAEARAVYKRGFSRRLEESGQLALCYDWLRFEREEGSPEDLLQASIKVEPILEEAKTAVMAATDGQAAADARHAARSAPKLTPEEMTALRRSQDPNFKAKGKSAKKRDRTEEPDAQAGHAKRQKAPGPDQQQEGPSNIGAFAQQPATDHGPTAMDEDEPAAAGAAVAARPEQPESQTQTPSTSQPAKPHDRVWHTDEHTAFVKGLEPQTSKEEVQQLFQPCGAIKEVRMTTHPDGTSRGFAYVEFENDEALQKAVEMNGTTLHDRRLFIAKSAPPKAGGSGRGSRGGRSSEGGRGGRSHDGGGFKAGLGFRGGRGGRGRGFEQHGGRHNNEGNGSHEAAPVLGGGGTRGSGRGRGPAALGYGASVRNVDHPHQHLQLGGGTAAGRPAAMLPRSVAAGRGAGDDAPKSNEEFRKMFLKKQ